MNSSWLKVSRLFCMQVIQEVRRVVWPTRRDVILTSIIVCILAFIFAVFLMFVDQVVVRFLQFILGVSHG